MANLNYTNIAAPAHYSQDTDQKCCTASPSDAWSIGNQAIYWAYLFLLTTGLKPFPVDVEAYAIRSDGGSSLTQLAFLSLFAFSIINALVGFKTCRQNLVKLMPIIFPLTLSFIAFFVATILSDFLDIGIRKFSLYVISTLTLLLAVSTAPTVEALGRSTARYLALILTLSVVGVFLFPERSVHQSYLYQGAWRGIVGHKNFMGAILVLSIFFFHLQWQIFRQWGWGALIVLALSFLWMTESKTSLAGLIVAALISRLLMTGFMSLKLPSLYWCIVAALCAGSCSFFLYGEGIFSTLGIEFDLTGRFPLWDLVQRAVDKPIIGHGFETFFSLGTASPLFSEGGSWSRFASHAHNGYLNIYVYGGLIGLISVFWFFIACYSLAKSARKTTRLAWAPLGVVTFETIRNITEVDAFTSVRVTFALTIVAATMLAQMAHLEEQA